MAKSILVAEDEFFIAMELDEILCRHGWLVLGPVATVREGLLLLETWRPDVALLDVTLKDGMVKPLAEALRALKVPMIVASAHHRPELAGGGVLADARNVGKPIVEDQLLSALRKATTP